MSLSLVMNIVQLKMNTIKCITDGSALISFHVSGSTPQSARRISRRVSKRSVGLRNQQGTSNGEFTHSEGVDPVLQVLQVLRKRSRRPRYSIIAGLLRTSLEVLRVLHLPRKVTLRCSKCCACQANAAGVHTTQSLPDIRGPLWKRFVCCTCHAQ